MHFTKLDSIEKQPEVIIYFIYTTELLGLFMASPRVFPEVELSAKDSNQLNAASPNYRKIPNARIAAQLPISRLVYWCYLHAIDKYKAQYSLCT